MCDLSQYCKLALSLSSNNSLGKGKANKKEQLGQESFSTQCAVMTLPALIAPFSYEQENPVKWIWQNWVVLR